MKRLVACSLFIAVAMFIGSKEAVAQVPSGLIPNGGNWWRNTATLDLDFYNDQYYLNGTTYSGIGNFITGAGATFTRSGTHNITATSAPFYLDGSQGQAFVSRASTATYFNSSGVLSTATTNTARINYTYNGSSWVNAGTLIEPAATNIQPYSADLTASGGWGAVNCTVAAGSVLGPDNSTYLDLITSSNSSGDRAQSAGSGVSVSSGTTYTFSIYASPGTSQYVGIGMSANGGSSLTQAGGIFQLSGTGTVLNLVGSPVSGSITQVGSNLYRLTLTATVQSGNTNAQFFAGVSDGSTYAFGNYPSAASGTINAGFAQVETGTVATSYIPTTSGSASRSADLYSVPNGGTYFNSSGVLKNAPANTARLDHDPSVSSYPSRGVLIEESRTNLAPYSAAFSSYTLVNASLTSNAATAPDGTSAATLLVPNTNSTSHAVRLTGATQTNGTTYTLSFFAKQGGYQYTYSGVNSVGAEVVDLTTCTITYSDSGPTYTATSVGNGWCRITETYTSNTNAPEIDAGNNSSGGAATFAGNGTSGVYIWGAQIEAGAFATSYIPTSGSSVTRAQDLFTVPTSAAGANGAWYTAGQGTLLAYAILPYVASGSYPGLASINDNSGNNSVDLYVNGPNMSKTATIFYQSSTAEMATGSGVYTPGNLAKMSIAYTAGSACVDSDGSAAGCASPANIPTVTQLGIGMNRNQFGSVMNGWERRTTYFPTVQPSASLPDYTR